MKNSTTFVYSGLSKVFLILSIVALLFCIGSFYIDVYRFAVVGAIFEFLWLPVMALLALLPLVAILCWVREKFSFRSLFLYAFLVSFITWMIILQRTGSIRC